MPFTQFGVVPDLIMNPHAGENTLGASGKNTKLHSQRVFYIFRVYFFKYFFLVPSRMTIGHLVECLLGKVGVLTGEEGNATPFTEVTVSEIMKRLHELGFEKLVDCYFKKGGFNLAFPPFEYWTSSPAFFVNIKINNQCFSKIFHPNIFRHGNEIMYNGHTGKKLPAKIFIGPTYYQRLKHMVLHSKWVEKMYQHTRNGMRRCKTHSKRV